ncbi:restriction endonuclease subunit S [Pseudarthrobacter sulfonivorans]|uniref:restriction endonuclease subunit S n=1 Tax=Pseudarthrobacter sulfonivorans TaxID=121292 RepID=UPI002107FD8F|nr:restriction endonuclease subunit S [Pseudarthrobacter sulfonivorans]
MNNDYRASGVPVIRGTNLGFGRHLGGDFAFVSEGKVARDLSRNTAAPDDVVFTQRGTLGQVALVPADPYPLYVVSQSQMRLRVDPSKALAMYVYYACASQPFNRQIVDNAISTGVPHINLGILNRLTIPLPSLREQQAIAEVLGALDDKIAANTKLAATARDLAESNFRLMMRNAADMATLSDIMSLEYGKALPTSTRRPGPVDVFGSGGVTGSHDQALCPEPGVIVGRKGTAGAVHWSHRPFFPIDTAYYVVPKLDEVSQVFSYFLLRTLRLDEMNNDSAVPGLNRNQAHAAPIRLPTASAIQEFTLLATELFDITAQRNEENATLAATRDTLLPQLMSGKLRVKDAESLVAAAV